MKQKIVVCMLYLRAGGMSWVNWHPKVLGKSLRQQSSTSVHKSLITSISFHSRGSKYIDLELQRQANGLSLTHM
jgi:hypothetical protein